MVSNPNVPWYDNVVVASSVDAYYWCFDDSTPDDKDPETTYEKNYGPFEKRIAKVFAAHGVPASALDFFDDWCRNLTRHVWVEDRHVTPQVVTGLFALLRRKYERWRIEVILVRPTKSKRREVGHLMIRKDWALCHGVARRLMNDVKRLNS